MGSSIREVLARPYMKEPEALLCSKELEIARHPAAGFLLRKHFLVRHGDIVRKGAGSSAKAELEKAGISGISGHTHRLATFRSGGYTPRQWTEQGGLCRTDPDYITGIPDWTQGLVIGEFSRGTGSFVVHEVPFMDGALVLGLSRYRA